MKTWVLLIGLLSSLVTGCSSLTKGKEMLKERSSFQGELNDLNLGVSNVSEAKLKESGIAHAWRHETELPGGDYFWGGWISIVVTKPQWAKAPEQN